jgi:hypothetical protein
MQMTRWVIAAAMLVACGGEPTAGPQPTNAPPLSTSGLEDTRPIHSLRPDAEPLAAAMRDLCSVMSRMIDADGALVTGPQIDAEFEAMRAHHGPILDDLDEDPRMHGRVAYPVIVSVLRERGVVFECAALARFLTLLDAGRTESLPRNNGN